MMMPWIFANAFKESFAVAMVAAVGSGWQGAELLQDHAGPHFFDVKIPLTRIVYVVFE
ncbi:hypothetical protein [Cerasicoccus fimbriatus]|uniref:hypothetical protein n=1 Tax=Cerasicoccus fimbriatus TaxID=3014554 RepID=UPI0022B47AAF|nr:hypothetical protein [Cerasicoccus sp. TK19100]